MNGNRQLTELIGQRKTTFLFAALMYATVIIGASGRIAGIRMPFLLGIAAMLAAVTVIPAFTRDEPVTMVDAPACGNPVLRHMPVRDGSG